MDEPGQIFLAQPLCVSPRTLTISTKHNGIVLMRLNLWCARAGLYGLMIVVVIIFSECFVQLCHVDSLEIGCDEGIYNNNISTYYKPWLIFLEKPVIKHLL